MIIFYNDGELPLDAIRLMGASVKSEGAFGRFGSGLKYAIATALRAGAEIVIQTGFSSIHFSTREVDMKGTEFEEVYATLSHANGSYDEAIPLGFTTTFGKDWEPWMVIRELGCNARDEGGNFAIFPSADNEEDSGQLLAGLGVEANTLICLNWPEIEADWDNVLNQTFSRQDILATIGEVEVGEGPSKYLYNRGVRIAELSKPSNFTYNIQRDVDLTEDRTLKYMFVGMGYVRNAILLCEDRSIIAGAVTAKDCWESSFDWSGEDWSKVKPGLDWLEEVAELREVRAQGLSNSATLVLLRSRAFQTKDLAVFTTREGMNDQLSDAASELEKLGFRLEDYTIYIAQDLPSDGLSAINNRNIYMSRSLLLAPISTIARELLKRMLEMESVGDYETLLDLSVEKMISSRPKLALELDREKEEAA